jgi:hypothetical protein
MVDIDRSVKAYYEQAELSEEQLQKLVAMQGKVPTAQQEVPTVQQQAQSNQWLRRSALAAASIMVAVMLFIVSGQNDVSIAKRVAQEVAMNHNKALAVEYQTDSYEVLSQSMDKLDFTLRAPLTVFEQGLELVGGRYCSIQGELAAQIKMTDDAGRVYTLYQTRSNEVLHAIDKNRLSLEQVNIQLWEEQGLLFALAETVE